MTQLTSHHPAVAQAMILLRDVGKTYETRAGAFNALSGIDLSIGRGEFVAVVGKSGSGKTTLLNLLAGIDAPTMGELLVDGEPLHAMSQDGLSRWRRHRVGVVFQFFQLLPTLTVAENVILPMELARLSTRSDRRKRALQLLDRLGIADQADKMPMDLSGGQQQRAAIARALANDPPIVVADEPTGNLDSVASAEVMALLGEVAASGRTVLTVTHERDMTDCFSRVVTLHDGAIADDTGPRR